MLCILTIFWVACAPKAGQNTFSTPFSYNIFLFCIFFSFQMKNKDGYKTVFQAIESLLSKAGLHPKASAQVMAQLVAHWTQEKDFLWGCLIYATFSN